MAGPVDALVAYTFIIHRDERIARDLSHYTEMDQSVVRASYCTDFDDAVDRGGLYIWKEICTESLPRPDPLGIIFVDTGIDGFSAQRLNAEAQRLCGMAISIVAIDGDKPLPSIEYSLNQFAGRITERSGKHEVRYSIGVILAAEASRRGCIKVFICYASGDRSQARELFQRLSMDGYSCWLDDASLRGGQDWAREITLAIERCDYVIVLLSQASISKRGFVQKELRVALDVADEQPPGRAYLIPVRVERCEIPFRLRHLHCIDIFTSDGYEKIRQSLVIVDPPSSY